MAGAAGSGAVPGTTDGGGGDSLYPIVVLLDELRNEDVQVLGSGRGAEAGAGRAGESRRLKEPDLEAGGRAGGSAVRGRPLAHVRRGPGALLGRSRRGSSGPRLDSIKKLATIALALGVESAD
ncbi:hypothetical protein MC885_017464 [Smutsia gigantea]|nr:hypothetical protein MC885_017464 [Smutsia gigantea]